MNIDSRVVSTWATLASIIFVVSACDEPQAEQATAAPPQVSIVTLQPSPRPYIRELPGRIAPTRVAEVRARVAGIVLERTFPQGADVKAWRCALPHRPGEVRSRASRPPKPRSPRRRPCTIRPNSRPSEVEKLISGQAASQAQYEIAVATFRQAQADVAARRADVARVKLDLDYTSVRSPINGRIGRAMVTEGALVGQGEATHMATVQQLDPVYADFTQSAGDLQQLRRDLESGALEQVEPDAAKVRLVLDDGTLYPLPGKLLFSTPASIPAPAK
jgi:membrane fusion protein (multidrug efflux system)